VFGRASRTTVSSTRETPPLNATKNATTATTAAAVDNRRNDKHVVAVVTLLLLRVRRRCIANARFMVLCALAIRWQMAQHSTFAV
jgi:hypothetical protein